MWWQVTGGNPFAAAVLEWAKTNDQRQLAVAREQQLRPSELDSSDKGTLADLVGEGEGL